MYDRKSRNIGTTEKKENPSVSIARENIGEMHARS